MAATNPYSPAHAAPCPAAGAALLALLIAGSAGAAERQHLEGSIKWSAEVLDSDFRSDTLDLSGDVRGTQGPLSIEAGAARARDFRSDKSQWTFERAVHIRTAEADLKASTASAELVNGQIASARIEGSPAQFEQITGTPNRQVRGRAGVIEYDFGKGIVKLTNQVWFSNGKDEFRGDVVIYDMREERMQATGGQSSGRVRGIIRPRERPEQPPAVPTTPDAAPEQRPNESGA